ncbi:AAA family ATPase [Methylobacterium oxalidis]|uniref:AAA family ATPase n=1 Tax=Methylobacterium oxalidis TaxID=944322 RepID=UPI0033158BD9
MAFSSTPRIGSGAARALLLPALPRRLRTCLDPDLRLVAAREGISAEIAALVPAAAPLAAAWIAAADEAGGLWQDPDFTAVRTALMRMLDAHAAEHDRPAARALSDVVALLSCDGGDRAAAARLALPLWGEVELLSGLKDHLPAIAAAQAALACGRQPAAGERKDGEEADRADTPSAHLDAWTEALEAAQLALSAEASAAAVAAAALGSGIDDSFVGGALLLHVLTGFGQRLTWAIEEQGKSGEKRRRKVLEAQLLREARQRRKAEARPSGTEDEARQATVAARAVPEGHLLAVARVQETGSDKGKAVCRGYEGIIGKALPLVPTPELVSVRAALIFEFPYAVATIDRLLTDLVGRPYALLRPSVLVGAPGAGKSRLGARIAHHLGLGLWRVDGTRDSGACIGGLDRRWATSEPCHPLMAMARHGSANPVMLVDEIEKAATRSDYGRLWDALLPMLEPETARTYPDPAFQAEVDLSFVSWLATANSLHNLPGPLLDRLRVIEMPAPEARHLEALVAPVLAGIAASRGLDAAWLPDLSGDELMLVRQGWRGGSIRRLMRLVEAIVAAREAVVPRH